jgi:hypothetical protein
MALVNFVRVIDLNRKASTQRNLVRTGVTMNLDCSSSNDRSVPWLLSRSDKKFISHIKLAAKNRLDRRYLRFHEQI